MEHYQICRIFEKGIEFGVEHGCFTKHANLFDYFESIGEKLELEDFNEKTKPVLWTVIIAGFNYGSNLKPRVMPDELVVFDMFENLIQGLPLEEGDNTRYDIKDQIDAIMTEPKKLTAEEAANYLIKENFPVAKYEALQNERNRRLQLWEERGIQILIEKEKELIAFGEEVLSLLRQSIN